MSHLKVSPARVGRKGAKIGYSDSEAAETSFEVLRKGPGKHRLLALGGFSHTDAAGPNSLRLPLRVAHHKLKPGRYELRATPQNASGKGPTESVRFKFS